MTPRPSHTPGAFETPRLAVPWQGRRANFLESLHVALHGPRAPREIDPAKWAFRLRTPPRRPPGGGIAVGVGFVFFYAAMAGGLISLTAPVAAVVGAADQPALVELAGEEAAQQLLGLLVVEAFFRLLVFDQLDRVEVAGAAHVADDVVTPQILQPAQHVGAALGRAFDQSLFFDSR